MPTTFKNPPGRPPISSNLFREEKIPTFTLSLGRINLRLDRRASRYGSKKFCLCPRPALSLPRKQRYDGITQGVVQNRRRPVEQPHDGAQASRRTVSPNAVTMSDAYRVTLYGSLAATGKGHLTDTAILSVLEPLAPTRNRLETGGRAALPPQRHAVRRAERQAMSSDSWTIYSIGGGALANETSRLETPHSIYPLTTVSEIKAWCSHEGKTYWEYVTDCEGPEIWDYLDEIWTVMCADDPARPEQRRRTARRA